MKRLIINHLVASTLILTAGLSQAEGWYMESDPFAFLLGGYSLHAGKSVGPVRVQAGVFGLDLPEGVRDNPAFDVRMDGFGLKLDYQGESDQGWFAGVDLDRTRERYSRAGFDSKATRQSLLLGMRGGYRYAVNKQLFVSPWFGMSANIGDKSRVQIGDEHYTPAQWQPFATMHVGMVF